MQSPKTIGVIINPKAGKGFGENAGIARRAAARVGGAAMFTGPGETGAAAFTGELNLTVCPCDPQPTRRQTMTLALALVERQVDLLVVVGGDGTLADVAFALASLPAGQASPPILGIGCGSTNVGPLVACRAPDVESLAIEDLETACVPAALVRYQGKLLGIGFNDCILGFTVLGTLDGVVRDLDAAAKMQGINRLGEPGPVGQAHSLVERLAADGTVEEVARGEWISSVAIGFSSPVYFGKAITGGVCLASYLGIPAGCLVTDSPMVRMETTRQEVLAMGSLRSQYISFDESMIIRVSGMRQGTAVCADGNPLLILAHDDQVEFSVSPEAVLAVKLK